MVRDGGRKSQQMSFSNVNQSQISSPLVAWICSLCVCFAHPNPCHLDLRAKSRRRCGWSVGQRQWNAGGGGTERDGAAW